MSRFALAAYCISTIVLSVNGHGRFMEPAGRASLWRLQEFQQFNPKPNYNDNECFCGGFYVQYSLNGGKCGVCGDAWHLSEPRPHEGGGTYGRGILTGNYTVGQEFQVGVELTASHYGYFEFRLCPHNNPLVPVTQECLDQYLLELADGSGTKYPITTAEVATTWHRYKLKFPEGVTCRQCVLQWHYRVGNSHGQCDDGSYELGCGNQEIFRGCADISIS